MLLASALRITGHTGEARALLVATQDRVEPELLPEYIGILALIDGYAPEDLLSRRESLPGEVNRVVATTYRTMALLAEGRVPQARVTFQRVTAWLAEAESNELSGILNAVACGVWVCYILDLYELGSKIAERALQLAHRHGQADVIANLGTGLTFCYASLGLLDDADAAGEQAIRDAERYGPHDVAGMTRAGLLVAAQGRNDPALLRERFQLLASTPLPELGWWRRAVLTIRTRTSALLGEPEPCPELLGDPKDAMAALRYSDAALVAAAQGDVDTAKSLIDEGLEIAEEQEQAGQRAMVLTMQAEILLRAGDALRAGNLFRTAREVFERQRMRLQLGRAQAGIAKADAQLTAHAEPLTLLTNRERDVAELVMEKLKNREIAARLSLSTRTVESHVRNVMKKLGVATRDEISGSSRSAQDER